MQINREGRVHPLAAVNAMADEMALLAGSSGGCLIATAMLTAKGTQQLPHVVPAGVFGSETSRLDDVDRAVLVAQLWLVVQEIEIDLGQESECGAGHFRDLVEAVRGSLVLASESRPIDAVARAVAGLGHSDCGCCGNSVSLGPLGGQEKADAREEDL